MSKKYPGGIIRGTPITPTATAASGIWTACQAQTYTKAGIWPRSPGAPTIGTATISGTTASVPFTAPTDTGSAAITTYTATSTPGCIVGTASSSPISVSGLTGGTSYTFKVKATNGAGTGPCSAASNSVTAAVIGQQAYTTPGSYTWVAPTGVTKVSVVAVGAGGATSAGYVTGSGGQLRYLNNQSVTPGGSYSVTVGCGCGSTTRNSSFGGVITAAGGASGASPGGGSGGTLGGNGGAGKGGSGVGGGAGGAGGYSGTGGAGACGCYGSGSAGSGGAGGGGSGGNGGGNSGGTGGGVGILGSGSNGAGGVYSGGPKGGGGGSGGATGDAYNFRGGAYGGGGISAGGGHGAVRIIWPGCSRSFPSTCTGNL